VDEHSVEVPASLSSDVTLPNQPLQSRSATLWDLYNGRLSGYMWIIFVLFGAFFIYLEPTNKVLRLGVPVLLMLFYAINGHYYAYRGNNSIRTKARLDQVADSVYFLGFIWTLWALIDSLVFKRLSASEAVFRTFGYALVTTAVGMFLRLALIQMSGWAEDFPGIEEKIEGFGHAVDTAILQLNQLARFMDKLRELRMRDLEDMKGILDEVARLAAMSALATVRKSIGNSIAELDTSIQGLNTTIKSSSALLGEATVNLSTGVLGAHASVVDAVARMNTALDKSVADVIKSSSALLGEATVNLSTGVQGAHASIVDAVARMNTAFDKSVADVEVSQANVKESALRKLGEVSTAAERTSHVLSQALGTAEARWTEAASGIRAALEGAQEALNESSAAIERDVSKISHSTAETYRVIQLNAEATLTTLKEGSKTLQSDIVELSEKSEETVHSLEKTRSDIENTAVSMRRTVQQLNDLSVIQTFESIAQKRVNELLVPLSNVANHLEMSIQEMQRTSSPPRSLIARSINAINALLGRKPK